MKSAVIALFFVAALSACATAARYEAALDTWIGQSEENLIAVWGPPMSVYEAPSGARVLTYSRERDATLPGASPSFTSTIVGSTIYTRQTGGAAPLQIGLFCSTSFTVDKGEITTWRYEGNDCVARP